MRNWQVEDGLPQNSVTGMCQSRDGYLWFTTFGGLARFDGIRFTVFNTANTPGFPADRQTFICNGQDESLWIGWEAGGVTCLKNGSWTTYGHQEGLPYEGPNTIYQDKTGAVWVGTESGLTCIRQGNVTRLTELGGEKVGRVYRVIGDGSDGLLIGTSTGLYTWRGGTLQWVEEVGRAEIISLLLDRTGNLWMGGWVELRCRTVDGRIQSVPTPVGSPFKKDIAALFQDPAGVIWVGTRMGLCWTTGPAAPLEHLPVLRGKRIRTVMTDHEGTLWVGTGGDGLFSFSQRVVTTIGNPGTTLFGDASTVFADRAGNVWIAGTGLLACLKDGIVTQAFFPKGIATDDLKSVCQDRQGDIWIGSSDGLYRLHQQTVTKYTERDGLSDGFVLALFVAQDGTLWAGTRIGLNRWNGSRFEAVGPLKPGPRSWVCCITQDREGTIWIATNGGLAKFQNGQFTFFTTENGLSNILTRTLRCEPDGTIWVGTYGGGLNWFKDGRFQPLPAAAGMPDAVVSSILDDGEGNFWLSGNRGIFRVRQKDLHDWANGKLEKVAAVGYDSNDGMASSETNGGCQPSGWRTADGRLWFPTLRGAVAVDPHQLNRQPPPVRVEDFNLDGKLLPIQDGMILEAGIQKLEIHYTALSFCIPSKVRFKYKLEGFDDKWVEVDTRRTAYFTSLPPGTYRFVVRACNNDGVWNETGASFSFTLKPRFFQTKWFFGFCGLAVFGLGIGINAWRVRRLQQQAALLTSIVAERTQTIQEEKERTEAALVETQVARLEAEHQKHEAEKAHELKTNLLNLAAHDLKSPLNTIKGFADLMLDGADETRFPPEYPFYLSAITQESDRMLAMLNELLLTAALENGNLRLRKQPCNLKVLAEGILLSLRPQAEAKNQTLLPQVSDVWVEVDPERFAEAVENLVNNAIKYSPPGKPIVVAISQTDSVARLAVRDEGPGLTEKDKQRVFGKFQRLSAEPTGNETSIGLGLSIVKQLVELHGGRVGVESTYRQGSEFWVEIPTRKD